MRRLALPLVLTLLGTAAAEPPPTHDYVLHCAGCHRFDGSGSERVPALDALAPLLDLPGGRAYVVRVPGVAQAPVSDRRLAALLNWVLAELAAGAPAPPFTAAEVGRLRRLPLRDPGRARARLVARAAPAAGASLAPRAGRIVP